MEINIGELRKSGRPLWMTHFDVESISDMLGGGGDYLTDRLPLDCARFTGVEDESVEETAYPEGRLEAL